jgi:hypothetical protein
MTQSWQMAALFSVDPSAVVSQQAGGAVVRRINIVGVALFLGGAGLRKSRNSVVRISRSVSLFI